MNNMVSLKKKIEITYKFGAILNVKGSDIDN